MKTLLQNFLSPENVDDKLPEILVNPEFEQSNIGYDDWASSLRKQMVGNYFVLEVYDRNAWKRTNTKNSKVKFSGGAGNAPLDCLLLVSRILDNSVLGSLSRFQKGILDMQRTSFIYSFDRRGRRPCWDCNPPSLPRKVPSSTIDWFRFKLGGKWHFDVGLGCLMFPLVNRLSQVNLNLLPIIPSAPVTVSSIEQSIISRDPVAMALYAIVVSVCAPVWEEIVFRGFLLPSLTRYMPVWCSILVSSIAFALAHFNLQRMLPLVFLGVVMGAVFARSRNLFASMLLHSLWNAFVFLDIMK
ncbi:hypothetical protein HYC85_013544 [Camellia sinensis]|uniref:CAAX prenyl protease 2/Lysostaphin resistance protein A-like domain-containing protein n=1 Tax=Camellia sinensis TaxID=4442 RepID=A0A7J7H4W0_CAMSI|nr:hypothetical protein HYC85_013544 [Camellia sinensis]